VARCVIASRQRGRPLNSVVRQHVTTPPTYPFTPKSNRFLEPGQFWQIPLSDGRYACGRILQIHPNATKALWGGLLDWVSSELSTPESIAGAKVVAEGSMHIKAIVANGGQILGYRPLKLDRLAPGEFRSCHMRGGCMLQCGYDKLRRIKDAEFKRLKVASTWGYLGIKLRAEERFVKRAA
jgi:Immunity protein 26